MQALAAVLGGTQSLHTNALDEAYALPTSDAALLALRTQQVIAGETGVTQTVDPFGGSYYVEGLTDELEAACWKEIETLDSLGGHGSRRGAEATRRTKSRNPATNTSGASRAES